MTNNIKLVVTDIDGTIANKDNEISQNVKDCINSLKKNNIKVVIATGRMFCSAEVMANKIDLKDEIIAYQGAIIQKNGSTQPLRARYVPENIAREIINELKTRRIHTQVYINDKIHVENDNEIVQAYAKKMYTDYTVVKSFDDIELKGVHKILAINSLPEIILDVTQEAQTKYEGKICVTRSTPYFCEFSHLEANKGSAIEFLADYYKIDISQVMALGDQDNDIEMIKTAGVGVAMGNATKALKEVSDYVTTPLIEDGFVYAVKKFVGI